MLIKNQFFKTLPVYIIIIYACINSTGCKNEIIESLELSDSCNFYC